jgi:hypothetical protein
VPNGRPTRQSTVETGSGWSRERIRETVGNLVACFAVDQAEGAPCRGQHVHAASDINHRGAAHARRCAQGIRHLLVRCVVFRTKWLDHVER